MYSLYNWACILGGLKMPFDGITTKAVVTELKNNLIGGKINKIFQPTKNEILLSIYNSANYVLDISADPNYCRINLTTHTKPNPQNAYNFCMLLRKYLIGGKIVDISNYDLERTIRIDFECYNELNDLVTRRLYIQIMSRQSNIVLTNENNIIIDCIKHSDNFLPAHPFEYAKNNKKSFLELSNFDDFNAIISNKNSDLVNILCNNFIGFSKHFISYTLSAQNVDFQNYTNDDLRKVYDYINLLISGFGTNTIYVENFQNDYVINLKNNDKSINLLIDDYYFQKEQFSNFTQMQSNLLNIVSNHLKKAQKKLENINIKLEECENMDQYRIYGELLTANLYQINSQQNLDKICVENYYDNNNIVAIPLDNKINVHKNIDKFFKKYNKLKNTLSIVSIQKKETENEINYLESIIFSLENASTISDIQDINSEISQLNSFKKAFQNTKNKSKKPKDSKIIIQSISFNGFEIYIGKNNIQNDYLSLKFANKNDIWFHTQQIHGCHVILRNSNNLSINDIPESVLLECGKIAKENSKGKLSSNVLVDYCLAKFVKKPNGAKPGFVIYTNYKTLNIK